MTLADRFKRLLWSEPIELQEQPSREALLDGAFAFLAAGGSVTLREWMGLSLPERAALQEARALLEIQRAIQAAKASAGPLGIAELLVELDGGDALAQCLCEAAAARAASGLEGRQIA